ncbi:MAG: hypothetical protein ACR2IB_08510 [Pyrinomonadaceae bacterium]
MKTIYAVTVTRFGTPVDERKHVHATCTVHTSESRQSGLVENAETTSIQVRGSGIGGR